MEREARRNINCESIYLSGGLESGHFSEAIQTTRGPTNCHTMRKSMRNVNAHSTRPA